MRLFIAVPLPDPVKEAIYGDAEVLKREGIRASYPAWENYHITLKFLGEVNESKVSAILDGMRASVSGMMPFDASIEGRGVFPGFRNPKVIWCGVEEGAESLVELFERVERAMAYLGFEREKKPFHPHVTVGRLKRLSPEQKRFIIKFCSHRLAYGRIRIERIVLYKSTLRPEGAVYTPLGSAFLGGRDEGGA